MQGNAGEARKRKLLRAPSAQLCTPWKGLETGIVLVTVKTVGGVWMVVTVRMCVIVCAMSKGVRVYVRPDKKRGTY